MTSLPGPFACEGAAAAAAGGAFRLPLSLRAASPSQSKSTKTVIL